MFLVMVLFIPAAENLIVEMSRGSGENFLSDIEDYIARITVTVMEDDRFS